MEERRDSTAELDPASRSLLRHRLLGQRDERGALGTGREVRARTPGVKAARTYLLAATRDEVWALLCDVPRTAAQIDAIRRVTPLGDDTYEGELAVKLGPLLLRFDGTVELRDLDRIGYAGTVAARASDPRTSSSVRAQMQFALADRGPHETELAIELELAWVGTAAELAKPLIQRKLADVLEALGERLEKLLRRLAATG